MKAYRYNTITKEVHRVRHLTRMCHAGGKGLKPHSGHWKECGKIIAYLLIWFCGYDGCAHCWKEKSKR